MFLLKTLIVAPHDTNTLYAATDIGVYVTQDNGKTWSPLTTGMPNVAVEKLVYNRNNLESDLIAFTYGRGTFKTRLINIANFAPEVTITPLTMSYEAGEQIFIAFSEKIQRPKW
jgi:hypothetical protein